MIETEKDREGWVTNLTTPGSLNLTIKTLRPRPRPTHSTRRLSGSTTTHVGEVQREGKIPTGNPSLMANQIQLHKSRPLFIPIPEGADGDLVL